jgi:hypothetical protein
MKKQLSKNHKFSIAAVLLAIIFSVWYSTMQVQSTINEAEIDAPIDEKIKDLKAEGLSDEQVQKRVKRDLDSASH